MFEQKSVSPLLDVFSIGTLIGEHNGISCYPAVNESSNRKYIIKVISIPASQRQLDALLITGAYKDPSGAAEYFKSLSDDVLREVEFLHKMAKIQGFLPFEGSQVEPMQRNCIGYEVFLLSSFRLSLGRYMHRQNVTHLEAVNLGLDICGALSACRAEGMLYVALKPSNIYISTKKEYKIGDLGFVPLDSLKYSAMPPQHRSSYTAPELMDELAVLNDTVDTYSLGMILYQIFNGGVLPAAPGEALPAPANADPEMAQIILKACAPNPADRWHDPSEMEQALIAYMQANTINDTPIMPPIPTNAPGKTGPAIFETALFEISAAPEGIQESAAEDVQPAEESTEKPEEELEEEPAEQEDSAAPQESEPPAEAAPEETVPEPESEPAQEPEPSPEPEPDSPSEPESTVPEEEEPETIPPESTPLSDSDGIAEKIEAAAAAEFAALTNANAETPAPSDDDPGILMDEAHLDRELDALNQLLSARTPKPEPKVHPNIEPVVIRQPKKKGRITRFFIRLMLVALLIAACFWGYLFYQTEYLKTIRSLSVTGALDQMQVTIESDIPDNLLTVVCTDAYGHDTRQRVRDGQASFQQLAPDSMYKVRVEIAGVHKLVGPTTDIFNTEAITNVVSFTAAVGNEDGSAILNLIVDGHEPDQWQVIYSSEGEPELGHTFSGHSTVLNDLVLGKTYHFRLEAARNQPVNGQTSLDFSAQRVITARNVEVTSCKNGVMTVQWDSELREIADSWVVHCTGSGYDEVVICEDYQAEFTGILSENSYTIEVSAKGMSQVSRITVSANPVTLTGFHVDNSDPRQLLLRWDYEGNAPEDGWLVLYTLDGSNLPSVLKSDESFLSVPPRVPGAVYHFTIQAANSQSVFNSTLDYTCPEADQYTGHGIYYGGALSFRMLPTPENPNWTHYSVLTSAYTNSFAVGQPISLVLNSNTYLTLENEEVNILYVFRDESGSALTELIAEQTTDWHDLWFNEDYHYAELNVPTSPMKPGNYTLSVYLNGMAAGSAQLNVY